MVGTTRSQLVIRSRVAPWGFLFALPLAAAFAWMGLRALETLSLLPDRIGVFVAPPPGLVGIAFLVFALFLALIGVSELTRYLRPSTEAVIDPQGIAVYGLLGERRMAWSDIAGADVNQEVLALRARRRGQLPAPDLRLHFSRLDLSPSVLLAAVRRHRPDLFA